MELITGVIDNVLDPVFFAVPNDEFSFRFMTDDIQNAGTAIKPIRLMNDDSFVYGRTHDNHRIAIYLGNQELRIYGNQVLNTDAYIISDGNINPDENKSFGGISFSGGTLNRVFNIDGMEFNYCAEDGSIGKFKDDSREFDIEVAGKKIHIDLRSHVTFTEGQDGKTINNTGVTLTLIFDCEEPLSEIFTHYHVVRRVLSFMTYRKNVGFDSISILRQTKEFNCLMETGKVFIRKDVNVELKHYQRNISVEDLDDSFPTLVALFYGRGNNSKEPMLGFLPENEKDVFYMTGDKLKAICSSLENELNYVDDILVEENVYIKEIKELMKGHLKAYKKDHPGFPEGAYNLISSSISNWSLTLRERLCALCQKYSAEISVLSQSVWIINSEAIHEFVKYRNSITHGNTKPMPPRVAETALVLSGVVYCCVLKRIGVKDEMILELAKHKMVC